MNLREIDPETLTIDGMAERDTDAKMGGDLRRSVEQQGVVQPPIAREDGGGLAVVVGARRVFAARKAGLDTIPVVVMDWGDADALEASITSNIEAFRADVTDNERGAAVARLVDLRGCTQADVASTLGVGEQTVRNWLEAARPEWEGTDVEPEFTRQKKDARDAGQSGDTFAIADGGAKELSAKVGGSTLRSVRRATGGGEQGEEMAYRIADDEDGMTQSDARSVAEQVGAGEDLDTATESVMGDGDTDSPSKVRLDFSLRGEDADSLTAAARANDTTPEQIARRALEMYLADEGWSK